MVGIKSNLLSLDFCSYLPSTREDIFIHASGREQDVIINFVSHLTYLQELFVW